MMIRYTLFGCVVKTSVRVKHLFITSQDCSGQRKLPPTIGLSTEQNPADVAIVAHNMFPYLYMCFYLYLYV